ncbi:MAG: hypothetical protein OEQ53_06500 [Saprospiraceae bacterium]|nr:hypothetical protein [Saprospiraceae bacterium]
MSHTGKVHEGDEANGDDQKYVMVVTEGFKQTGNQIRYLISTRLKGDDYEYNGDIEPGTAVTFTTKAVTEELDQVEPLDDLHFLKDTIEWEHGREMIRQKVKDKIGKNLGKKVAIPKKKPKRGVLVQAVDSGPENTHHGPIDEEDLANILVDGQ